MRGEGGRLESHPTAPFDRDPHGQDDRKHNLPRNLRMQVVMKNIRCKKSMNVQMFKTFLYTAALTTVLALEPARKTWNKKLLIMTLKTKFVINIAQDKTIPFHRF